MFNGQKIKNLIIKKGLTQNEVFNKANIKETTFYSLFKSKANPSSNTLESIADALNCRIDDFFDRHIEQTDKPQIGHHVNGNGNTIGDFALTECQNEVKHLKEILSHQEEIINQKDELIKEKERLITLLMEHK